MPDNPVILFDLIGTLIDPMRLAPAYSEALGAFMSAGYGMDAKIWQDAYQRIREDWHSYYADLDLGADDGIEQMHEAQFRTTRALFRLVGIPAPNTDEIWQLTDTIPQTVYAECGNCIYPQTRDLLRACIANGAIIGIQTELPEKHARAVLRGIASENELRGPIIGSDTLNYFGKDHGFYARLRTTRHIHPAYCIIADDSILALEAAGSMGFDTCHINPTQPAPDMSDALNLVFSRMRSRPSKSAQPYVRGEQNPG